jgi:hypothetical protein
MAAIWALRPSKGDGKGQCPSTGRPGCVRDRVVLAFDLQNKTSGRSYPSVALGHRTRSITVLRGRTALLPSRPARPCVAAFIFFSLRCWPTLVAHTQCKKSSCLVGRTMMSSRPPVAARFHSITARHGRSSGPLHAELGWLTAFCPVCFRRVAFTRRTGCVWQAEEGGERARAGQLDCYMHMTPGVSGSCLHPACPLRGGVAKFDGVAKFSRCFIHRFLSILFEFWLIFI